MSALVVRMKDHMVGGATPAGASPLSGQPPLSGQAPGQARVMKNLRSLALAQARFRALWVLVGFAMLMLVALLRIAHLGISDPGRPGAMAPWRACRIVAIFWTVTACLWRAPFRPMRSGSIPRRWARFATGAFACRTGRRAGQDFP
jgi:hypothetical protein